MNDQDNQSPDLPWTPSTDVVSIATAETLMDTDVPFCLLGSNQEADQLGRPDDENHGGNHPGRPVLLSPTPADSPVVSQPVLLPTEENATDLTALQDDEILEFSQIASFLSPAEIDLVFSFFNDGEEGNGEISRADGDPGTAEDDLCLEAKVDKFVATFDESLLDDSDKTPHAGEQSPDEGSQLHGNAKDDNRQEIPDSTPTELLGTTESTMPPPDRALSLELVSPLDDLIDLDTNNLLDFRRFATLHHPTGATVEDPYHPANVWRGHQPWSSIEFEGGLLNSQDKPFLKEVPSPPEDEGTAMPTDRQILQPEQRPLVSSVDQNGDSPKPQLLQNVVWCAPNQTLGGSLPGTGEPSNPKGEVLPNQQRRGSLPEPLYTTPVVEMDITDLLSVSDSEQESLPPPLLSQYKRGIQTRARILSHLEAGLVRNQGELTDDEGMSQNSDGTPVGAEDPRTEPHFIGEATEKEKSELIASNAAQYSYPVCTVTDEILLTRDPPDLLFNPHQSPSQDPPNANESLNEESLVLEDDKEGSSIHGSDSGVSSAFSEMDRTCSWIFDPYFRTGPTDLQVYTVTIEDQDGASGGDDTLLAGTEVESMVNTPAIKMQDMDVLNLNSREDDVSADRRKFYKQLLEQIPKVINSIKPSECQTVKQFSPALKGSELLAPDTRPSHEIFRRGQIVSWENTGADNRDALITVRFQCPTLESDCVEKKCPWCQGKDYEYCQYFFPARGAAAQQWLLIINQNTDMGDKLIRLNQLLKNLFSYLSDPEPFMRPEDSVSCVSDVTNFPEDPDPRSEQKDRIRWRTVLCWPHGFNNLVKSAELQGQCDKLKGRIQAAHNQIIKLEHRDTLPYSGKQSLANVMSQLNRFFAKKEEYDRAVIQALKQLNSNNCGASLSDATSSSEQITKDLLWEAADLVKDMERRFNHAGNQWNTRLLNDKWEAYRKLPDQENHKKNDSTPSKGKLESSSDSRRRSRSPPRRRAGVHRRTSSMSPGKEWGRRAATPQEDREENPFTKKVQESFARRQDTPPSSSSSSPLTSDSEERESSVSETSSAATVRHAKPSKPPRSDASYNKRERAQIRSNSRFTESCTVSKLENPDFARIIGSKHDLKHYLQVVSSQIIDIRTSGGSNKIMQSARKLQQEIQSWVETMIRHNQPSFTSIAEFSESQLKEEVDLGNAERLKLSQRVAKGETSVELAVSDLVSALMDSKSSKYNTWSWTDTKERVEELLRGPGGRTHTDLAASWEKFFVMLSTRIRDAAKKQNIIKNTQKSSMTAKDMTVTKFSGEAGQENFYVWLKDFRTITHLGGFTSHEQVTILQKALIKGAKVAVGNKLNGGYPVTEIIEFLRDRYGRPSVIISQAKERHHKIGSLDRNHFAATSKQDLAVIMAKLDAHLQLITEVEQVEVGLVDHDLSKLPPGATTKEVTRVRRRAGKEVYSGEYLLTLKYLTPLAPDMTALDISASSKEKFLHYKQRLIKWSELVQLDQQERPKDLRTASSTAVMVTERVETSTCLASSAAPTPANPPQSLAGNPGGEELTKLQKNKAAGRQAGRGRGGPSSRGKGAQKGPARPPRSQSAPPVCSICKSLGLEEYHDLENCPSRSTPRQDNRICCACLLYSPKGEKVPSSTHVVVGKKVQRHLCGTLRDLKVSELANALLDQGWCLNCIVPPRLHQQNPINSDNSCNRNDPFKCTVCSKHSKTCIEHYNQNKAVHEKSAKVARDLGLSFNHALVVTRDEDLSEDQEVEQGTDQIALFASMLDQPELEFVRDSSLKRDLEPRMNLLEGLQMELPTGKVVFIMFDTGSTENMATSEIVGRHIKARTHPDIPKARVRGYGGHKEVRTVQADIPIRRAGISKMTFQETKEIIKVKTGTVLPLLKLLQREHQARLALGLLSPGDSRADLSQVKVASYGGEIHILFGIAAGQVQPQRLFLSVTGAFIFSTALDTGRCPPYGVAGPQPELEDFAEFITKLENKDQLALEKVKKFLLEQQEMVDITSKTTLTATSDRDQESADYIDPALPDLPGWIPKDLAKEVKQEMRDDSTLHLITRHNALQNIPGASNAVALLQLHLPGLFKLFCGDLVTAHPASSWKLLAAGADGGLPLFKEVANWLWTRINSSPHQVGVSLGLSGEEFDDLSPSCGYVAGLVVESDPDQGDLMMHPENWVKPGPVHSWLQNYGRQAEISGMTKEETAIGALAVLDIYAAPRKTYVSWVNTQSVPRDQPPTTWDNLVKYYPRYLASLNGEPLPCPSSNNQKPDNPSSPVVSIPRSKTWSNRHQTKNTLTQWIESSRWKGTHYLGLSTKGLGRAHIDQVKLINRWLEPEHGEMKNVYTFAKRLGPDLGKHSEMNAIMGNQIDLESAFLAVPLLHTLDSNYVYHWIQILLMLTRLTNFSVYEKKRTFLRALAPKLIGNLDSFKYEHLLTGLSAFTIELFRVITEGQERVTEPLSSWLHQTRPAFGHIKEHRSGCSRFFNAILDPGELDDSRSECLTPVTFPILNSMDTLTVSHWTWVCEFLITNLNLDMVAANRMILSAISIALKPVLTKFLKNEFSDYAYSSHTLLAIQARFAEVNNEKLNGTMIDNLRGFFLEKFSAIRREVKHTSVTFTCQSHLPEQCAPNCLCLGCEICLRTCGTRIQYLKQMKKYVWLAVTNDQCFACQGQTVSVAGTSCECDLCVLISKVLSFSLDKLLYDDKSYQPYQELSGVGKFDTRMAKRYNPTRDIPKFPEGSGSNPREPPIQNQVEQVEPEPTKDVKMEMDEPAENSRNPPVKCGYECKNACIVETEEPCENSEYYSERCFLWERRERLPVDASVKYMDGIEVHFWHKHFKNEEELGTIDYSKKQLYRDLVKARRAAWTLIGCKKCRSATTKKEVAARINCPNRCQERVTRQEVIYHKEDGIFFRPGWPSPVLEPWLHVPPLRDNRGRLSSWPHEQTEGSPVPRVDCPNKPGRKPAPPPRTSSARSPKDWKDNWRTILHVQYQHTPVSVGELSCCSINELPAIFYDSEQHFSSFKNNLEHTAREFLMQKNNGELVPRPSTSQGKGFSSRKSNVNIRASNDNNIDMMLTGLYTAYRENRTLISLMLADYPHYEVSLKCSPACSKGCLTPELGCLCEGCILCKSGPGLENCFLAFSKRLQDDFNQDWPNPPGLIRNVLRFDFRTAERDAKFLAQNGGPNSTGKRMPLRQSSYRRKMCELRALCTEFPGARITSGCQTACQQEGRCLGVDHGCYCDGCLFCSETIGLGKTHIETSEFTRRLRQDKTILKKVQALQSLNLELEKRVAETSRHTEQEVQTLRVIPAAHQRRGPLIRAPLLGTILALLFLILGAAGQNPPSLMEVCWADQNLPLTPEPQSAYGSYGSTHSTTRTNSSQHSLVWHNSEQSLVSKLHLSKRPDSSNKYLFEAANRLYLWTMSSVVAFSSREIFNWALRLTATKMRLLFTSSTSIPSLLRPADGDPDFHRFLIRNTKRHRHAYWIPLEPDLKREIDKELFEHSRMSLVSVGNPDEDPRDDPDSSFDCFHCHNGCPLSEETQEDEETQENGDEPRSCLTIASTLHDMMEKLNEEGMGPYMRCQTCRLCKVCGNLGEAINMKLRKTQENEYIRSCISFHDHPSKPGEKEIYMEYPKREGWENKLAHNRDLAVKNLQSVARTLLGESPEAQEMVMSQMQKLIDNKFILPVEEVPNWDQLVKECPVPGGYYTTHTLAYKPNSANTEVRLCANFSKECSTGKCFNNYLVPGDTNYNFRAFNTATRQKPALASSDISKFFNSVKLVDKDKVLCRILWFSRNITTNQLEFKEYCLATGWYGAASQPCLMEHVKDGVEVICPEIQGIHRDYVDDLIVAEMRARAARKKMELLTFTYSIYQLKSKGIAVSGEDPDPSLLGNGGYVDVGGMHWDSKLDLVQANINPVYVGKKVKGRLQNAKVFTGSSLEEILEWGEQFCWTVKSASEQLARTWDYASGMVSGFRGELSVILRAAHDWAHLKGVEEGSDRRAEALWNRELPDFLRDRLLTTLFYIQDYSKLWFPRCSVSTDDFEDPDNPVYDLITFADAGAHCLQTVHYILYKVKPEEDGTERWKASYLWSSNKLRPVLTRKADGTQAQQTMPKSELAAMAIGAAGAMEILATNTTDARNYYLGSDSTCGIQWSTSSNCVLDPYTNPRVQFIREHYPLEHILYVRSEDQPADIGTKGLTSAKDIGPDSLFFKGPSFLSKGIEACIGKELLTYKHIPGLQAQGSAKQQEKMAAGTHSEKQRRNATKKLEEIHNKMILPKEHLTNLMVGDPTYFDQFGRHWNSNRAEVTISVAFTFTRAHLLSILTLAPRMNFLVDKQKNTITLYSANDKPALRHKSRISTEVCEYSGVCFLLGRYHHHSPLTAAISNQADRYLPPKVRNSPPPPQLELELPMLTDPMSKWPSSPFNTPNVDVTEQALTFPPSVVKLSGKPAKEIEAWTKTSNNIYVGANPSIPLGFLQEYWTCNGTSSHQYRESLCSDTRHIRTIPFLKGKQLGCDCDENESPCHAKELLNIYHTYYTEGPETLFKEAAKSTIPPPQPHFLTALAPEENKTCLVTSGTLKKIVRDDELNLNVTARPLDRIFTTVSLMFMTVEKWYARCATSGTPTKQAKWYKRIEGLKSWETQKHYLTDFLEVNPLNALMGHSPEQQGRHTNDINDKLEQDVPDEGYLDEFLQKAAWYSYPGFSLIFKFCRTAIKESDPSFDQLNFQFTSILILLTSLLKMSKTKHSRPGLFTACRAAFCWVKFACASLEANFLSALLDLPDLARFYDTDIQHQRLQPQTHKRYLLKNWHQPGFSLKTTELGHLPKYGIKNQVSILWATLEACSRLVRQAGYYLTLKTQRAHSAFLTKDTSNRIGQVNDDGVRLSPRRLRQAIDLSEILDIPDGKDREKLQGLRLNPDVPYIPMSPLTLAIVQHVHHHFRHSPVKLFSKTRHRSTAMDILYIKAHVDGPGILSLVTRKKLECYICGLTAQKKCKSLCGTIDENLKPNYRVNDRVFADLAGPYKVGQKTAHILVWVCTGTGYVSAWPLSSRSRESFTIANKILADMHNGYPREYYTDRESGLTSLLDGALFEEKNANTFQTIRVAIRVFLCAAYNHQAHGAVERRIRTIKGHLGTLDWSSLTFQELSESLISIVRIINSTPVAAKLQGELNPVIELISPQDLMTPGRTNSVVTPIVYHKNYELMKEELASHNDAFVKTWQQATTDVRLSSQVFQEQTTEPTLGDIVVMQDPHSMKPKIQTGVIVELLPGLDGIVRKVAIRLVARSKKVVNQQNDIVSVRSVRDLCIIPRMDSHFGEVTLGLEEKQKLVSYNLPGQPEQNGLDAIEEETQPIDQETEEPSNLEYRIKKCDVLLKRLPSPASKGSRSISLKTRSQSRESTAKDKANRPPPSQSNRVLRSSQSQATLTTAFLASLVVTSQCQSLNMTQENKTLTVLPEVITAVGFDIESTFTTKTPMVKHLSLLTSHTCEVDETKYDEANALQLQAVFTQTRVDVEVYQCRVLAGLKASWCGSNLATKRDTRMHAAVTVITPTILKLSSEQCRTMVENKTLLADLYRHDGTREYAKTFMELNIPYGLSTREEVVRGEILSRHACLSNSDLNGPTYIKGVLYEQHVITRSMEFLVRKHKGVYDSETDQISVPGLVSFDSTLHYYFENQHGTFTLDNSFVAPNRCSRSTNLFSGMAKYYHRRQSGQQPKGQQKGDIVIMTNPNNNSVAFVTAGTTEFCNMGLAYRTSLKGVHLIPYQTTPPFKGTAPSSFGTDPYLSLKSEIGTGSITGRLSVASVAYSLHERACQLNTISNLIKLGLLAAMPEAKLLDTYHGMAVRRVGGVATVLHGVPLPVQLEHRVAGRGVCCAELSVTINGTNNLPQPTFIFSISRVLTPHCTPVICSKQSPIYHAIPGPSLQDLLLKGERYSWEDIHELQKDYEDNDKSFWICDDSEQYYICQRPPSVLTTSPLIDKSATDEIWTSDNDKEEPGALWTSQQEDQFRSHQWVTTALAATSQALGVAMSGRHLRVQEMHQQIIELEPRAKTAIINGFFPSFWNIAEYIPQFMLSGVVLVVFICILMLFCCFYNTLQDVRTCTAGIVNSAGLVTCNRRLVDEENAKLTLLDVKIKLRQQTELMTDLVYRVDQNTRRLQAVQSRELESLGPPPYPEKE